MEIQWQGKPSRRDARVSIDHGTSGDYCFNLCHRQEDSDPYLYRLFVYHKWKGWQHLGGFNDLQEARDYASKWQDLGTAHGTANHF